MRLAVTDKDKVYTKRMAGRVSEWEWRSGLPGEEKSEKLENRILKEV